MTEGIEHSEKKKLGNTGIGDERKTLKRISQEYEDSSRKTFLSKNLIKRINTWTVPARKILGTISDLDQRRTSTNGPENK